MLEQITEYDVCVNMHIHASLENQTVPLSAYTDLLSPVIQGVAGLQSSNILNT